jgi:mitochondrial inner membrane protease ATP23
MIDTSFTRNVVLKFLVEKMEEAGCPLSKNFVRVETCDMEVGGGFRPAGGAGGGGVRADAPRLAFSAQSCSAINRLHSMSPFDQSLTHFRFRHISCCSVCYLNSQVIICHNYLGSQEEVDHALLHELVHAYDHCRASNLDWANCEHHACSEVCGQPYVPAAAVPTGRNHLVSSMVGNQEGGC